MGGEDASAAPLAVKTRRRQAASSVHLTLRVVLGHRAVEQVLVQLGLEHSAVAAERAGVGVGVRVGTSECSRARPCRRVGRTAGMRHADGAMPALQALL